jgi:large subunit ribosomal protein L17
MRHLKSGRKLGRNPSHRRALYRNLVTELVSHDRIRTTDEKAKEIRRFADRMVTLGKKGTVAARRQALAFLRSRDAVQRLFDDVAKRFVDRAGGYTRIVKLGVRPGDNATMSLIEFTGMSEMASGARKRRPARKAAPQGEARE